MDITLFLIIFSALTIFYLIVGTIASRSVNTTTDYFLAGRNLSLPAVTSSLIATQLGGGMLVGTSQEAYNIGIYGIMYTIGIMLGFLFLGCGLAGRLQALNVATTAELFETHYGSSRLKQCASLLSVMTMCGILVAQIIASKTVLAGVGLDYEWLFISFWLFIIIYTMLGGLKAVVLTDMYQVIFIICTFTTIFGYMLWQEPVSFFSVASLTDMQSNFGSLNLWDQKLLSPLLMTMLFSFIEQDLAQRFFAARTKRIAALAALCASMFIIAFSLIPIYLGMKARMLGLVIPAGTSPLMPLIAEYTNDFALACALCGIIAAITSTADSLLCAVSSNLAQDFDTTFIGGNALRRSKTITLIVGVVAVGASYFVPQNVIDILSGSYELSVSCLLVPLVVAYFGKKRSPHSAVGAIIGGLIGFVGFRIWPIPFAREVVTLALSAIGFIIGNRL